MNKPASLHSIPSQAKESASNIAANAQSRAEIAHALSFFLASTYTLYQKSLFYHWNVTGPNFVSLHQLFEEHYEELHKAGDQIAERIRALGHAAPGTLEEFSSLSAVSEDRVLPTSYSAMIANLLGSHELCSREAKKVFDISEKAGDPVTSDLMVQRMAFHDKAAWMLRALKE